MLVDRDQDDCQALKARLDQIAQSVGFTIHSVVDNEAQFQVLNRLAIEELEAWFFGDIAAICAAYPRIPATLGNQAKYCNPGCLV